MYIPSFILIGCCVSELHGHLCAYRNVRPEAVCCCFARTTLFTTMFTVIIVVCSLKSMSVPSFILIACCSVSYMAIYVPIVMYGLRLFIVILQELHCLSKCLHACMIRIRICYHITKFCYSIPSGF